MHLLYNEQPGGYMNFTLSDNKRCSIYGVFRFRCRMQKRSYIYASSLTDQISKTCRKILLHFASAIKNGILNLQARSQFRSRPNHADKLRCVLSKDMKDWIEISLQNVNRDNQNGLNGDETYRTNPATALKNGRMTTYLFKSWNSHLILNTRHLTTHFRNRQSSNVCQSCATQQNASPYAIRDLLKTSPLPRVTNYHWHDATMSRYSTS